MKVFEEKFPKPTTPPGPFGENHPLWEWEEARESWKVALEWVLSHGWPADTQPSLESIIEKELEDK